MNSSLCAESSSPSHRSHKVLFVSEHPQYRETPKNFRSSHDQFKQKLVQQYKEQGKKIPSRQGLETLNFSASAQFSEESLIKALPKMRGKIYIVDLRLENHLFINGKPYSWFAPSNQEFQEHAKQKATISEKSRYVTLKNQLKTIAHDIIHKTKTKALITKANAFEVNINSVQTEKEIVNELGLEYQRFHLRDRGDFPDQEIDLFIDFVDSLPKDAWLHFHCRAGRGRATTMSVIYDIYRNGKNVSFDDIVKRQALIGSKNLYEIKIFKDDMKRTQGYQDRLQKIRDFHHFVNAPNGLGHMKFSEWRKMKLNTT